jgi:hypothetical protein
MDTNVLTYLQWLICPLRPWPKRLLSPCVHGGCDASVAGRAELWRLLEAELLIAGDPCAHDNAMEIFRQQRHDGSIEHKVRDLKQRYDKRNFNSKQPEKTEDTQTAEDDQTELTRGFSWLSRLLHVEKRDIRYVDLKP